MKQEKAITPRIQVKTYSIKEMAELYCVSRNTFRKWLTPFEKEIGERIGYLYNPKQVMIIFENLGIPD
jgi:hypothetical protein